VSMRESIEGEYRGSVRIVEVVVVVVVV
jgi:hypothetical protein